MWPIASWTCPDLKQNATFNWDVVGWPIGEKPRVTGAFGSGYGMGRDSKNRDLAWLYLSEYLNKDGMIFMWGSTGRGSPAREAAYQSWMESPVAPKNAQAFLDATKNYELIGHPYKTTAAAELLALVEQHMDLIMSADETVEQAVAAIESAAQPILAKATVAPSGTQTP
jgi:multiple sugar transport system substrate-binding protein